MPLGFGLATSHPVYLFIPVETWDVMYQRVAGHVTKPKQAEAETLAILEGYRVRIDAAFETLRTQLAAYKPDVLIIVSDDQGEVFDNKAAMPSIGLFMGQEAAGVDALSHRLRGDAGEPAWVHLCGHPELAEYLAEGLVQRGFDITSVRDLGSLRKEGRGLGHGFVRIAPKLVPDLDIPVIPLFLNCYFPPLPTAERCLRLGDALREILEERPERVAICGSGGLSHDPGGPRAGWIDEPLDNFVLQALAAGKPERLSSLYLVDSDTMRGGTGEIRNWLVAAGGMGARKATVVDYIPAYRAVCGLGFAYWPSP